MAAVKKYEGVDGDTWAAFLVKLENEYGFIGYSRLLIHMSIDWDGVFGHDELGKDGTLTIAVYDDMKEMRPVFNRVNQIFEEVRNLSRTEIYELVYED